MRKLLLAIIPALLIGAAAYAGNTTFFTSIGDQVFPFSPPTRAGAPGALDNMIIGAATPRQGAIGSTAVNPTPTSIYRTYTFSDDNAQMLFTPSGTVSYAYITLAAAPINGQQACVFSTAAITTLYLAGSGSQTVANAITALTANVRNCYTYSLANTTWYRSQ